MGRRDMRLWKTNRIWVTWEKYSSPAVLPRHSHSPILHTHPFPPIQSPVVFSPRMTFLFALLLCWIISVFFQAVKSFLIPNIPLPTPHFPPSQTVSTRQPDVSVPTSPFPLLHIPYLPLGRIIDFMDPKTLVSLSFCSQKTHSVIKTQRRAPFAGRLCVSELDSNLSFRTFGNNNYVLSVRDCSYFSSSERSDYVIMKGQYVPVEVYRSKGNLVSYWYNTTDGLKTITDYVTDLFNIDVSEVRVSKNAINMIEWAIIRQKTPLESVTVCGVTSSEEELIYILRDCRCSAQAQINSYAPPNFRFSKNFRRIDFLYILYGQWVTLDNLLTMDGIDIILGFSSLSDSDFNLFLKHWLAGGCPRLKYLDAGIHSVNILQVLAGLMHNTVYKENSRNYTSPSGYTSILSDGYDIQRSDGVTATVNYQPPRTFVIAVWPEAAHNSN
ncbi:hypothetical protein CRE_04444 [Caenorhabditis remanei]|uniref:F-box domain-containing protein n=1 Tax=Caenorhabditis remanei TaxID=31234 RepID=E3NS12_CAERE|nr:hypothetical protein CRE_04444 [Caenorhabditis remanei]